MKATITVLVVHIAGWEISQPYDTQAECSAAMVQVAESELGADWQECRETFAPSTSPRPVARPLMIEE